MKHHLSARRKFMTAVVTAALVVTSAHVAQANDRVYRDRDGRVVNKEYKNRNLYTVGNLSCNGFNDNSTSANMIQKGGRNLPRIDREPAPNNSCHPGYTHAAVRYDMHGNPVRR